MQAVKGKELSQKYGGDISESVVDTFPSHLAPPGFWPQFFDSATCSFQLGCGSTQAHAEGGCSLNSQESRLSI